MYNVWSHFRQYAINRFWAGATEEDEATPKMDMDDYLRMAVIHGGQYQVSSLLNLGANVRRKDHKGYTILHTAVKVGRFEMIKKLVKYGNGIEKESDSEYRPLIHSILYSKKKEQCFDALVKAKISLNTVDFSGNSILHRMAQHFPCKVDFIEKIMGLGLDPSTVNELGNNCLHLLASSGHSNRRECILLAAKFLKKGVDINAVNLAGETALQRAAKGDRTRLVDFLLRVGAAIHLVDNSGTAVYESLLAGNDSVVSVSLKHFALRKFRGDLENKDRLLTIIESDISLRKIYSVFENELTRIQLQRIHRAYEVTYLDILCQSKKAVVKYLKYPGIKDRIHILHFNSARFHYEIKHRLDEVKEVLKAEELAFLIVNRMFHPELSYVSVKRVTKFLAPQFLEIFKKYS